MSLRFDHDNQSQRSKQPLRKRRPSTSAIGRTEQLISPLGY
jgi:hypothetical protein